MDFADLLKKRRMVRRFRTDPIPREALERIARTAKRAPSAGFTPGQRLVIGTETKRAPEPRFPPGPAPRDGPGPSPYARGPQGPEREGYGDIGLYRWVS